MQSIKRDLQKKTRSYIQTAQFCAQVKAWKKKYKGVTQTASGKFRAWRRVGDVVHIGGIYEDDVRAAQMSDKLAQELWFSGKLNFPNQKIEVDLTPKQRGPRPKDIYLFAYSCIMIETDVEKLEVQVDSIFEKANTFNPDVGLSGRLIFFPVNLEPCENMEGGNLQQIGESWEKPVWGRSTYFRNPEGAAHWKGVYGCYQILEGTQETVEALYSRISADPRVKDMVVHYGRTVGASSFPSWGMQVEVTNSIIDWSEERVTMRFA